MIKPVHKKNSTGKETNYRRISLSSCLAKFFNNLILDRLSLCFEKLNIFHPHIMGFRPGIKTVNNVIVLKTLIEKQFGKHEKLYCCFVDFSKAFDSVWRNRLLAKMKFYGISGKILSLLSDLYKGTVGHLKIYNLLSDPFIVSLGLKQEDPSSPFFFNLYMNDLCPELLQKSSIIDSPPFSNTNIFCLLWADDLVLMSKTDKGLQEQIDILVGYSYNWKLKLNIEKTKVIIFNKR